jgi:hypothetical protein
VADRSIKLKELRANLARFGVGEDPSMGKGSHTTFFKRTENGVITYPVPTTRDPVLICYVRNCRRRFSLRTQDGVTDREFYGK